MSDEIEKRLDKIDQHFTRWEEYKGPAFGEKVGQSDLRWLITELRNALKRINALEWDSKVTLHDNIAHFRQENDELRVEVDKLSQAIGLMTTALPMMEMDANDPVNMARSVVAEVERLNEEYVHICEKCGKEEMGGDIASWCIEPGCGRPR